jgi:hypothetical protein
MSQSHLIESILEDLQLVGPELQENAKTKELPSFPTYKIMADTSRSEFTYLWHYFSVIWKLNFIENSTWQEISYVVHQLTLISYIKNSHMAMS